MSIHGASWKAILEDNAPAVHEWALYGVYGQTVNVTDGRFTYAAHEAGLLQIQGDRVRRRLSWSGAC